FTMYSHPAVISFLFLSSSVAHPDLHSFPTRRSSDLSRAERVDHGGHRGVALHPPLAGDTARRGDGLLHLGSDDEGFLRFALSDRSEEHTSELQSRFDLVCRLLLEKKKKLINCK